MRILLPLLLVLAACGRDPEVIQDDLKVRAEDIRKHQSYLGSTELEGRAPGSEGSRKASVYIAAQMEQWGYKPAGTDGGWYQPFGEGRRNVVAVQDSPMDEIVVLGAHYDHLGKQGDTVLPGADDNASGTSTLLDVAEAVSKARYLRKLVFIWFDGEENQLEGSRWWTSHPTLPLGKVVAMVNLDMIGRNETTKVFCGVEKLNGSPRYPKLAGELEVVETQYQMKFDRTEFDPYIKRSDHWPFMEKGVPALFFTGGLHADYHKAGDTIEKINFEKEERVGRMVVGLIIRLASHSGPLK